MTTSPPRAVAGSWWCAEIGSAFDATLTLGLGRRCSPPNETYEQQRAREAEANAEWQRQRYAAYLLRGGGSAGGYINPDGSLTWRRI